MNRIFRVNCRASVETRMRVGDFAHMQANGWEPLDRMSIAEIGRAMKAMWGNVPDLDAPIRE